MFKTHRSFNLSTGVKNNTIAVVETNRGALVVYHKTIVVESGRVGAHRYVKLNNGGWDTVSTRLVINNALNQLPGFMSFSLQRVKNKTMLCWNNAPQAEFSGEITLKPGPYAAKVAV